MLKRQLQNLLAYPNTQGLDLDDPGLTERRKAILNEKKFLRKIYQEWYQAIVRYIPDGPGNVLELGSGAGFLDVLYPQLIKSEIFWLPDNHLVLDGCRLPFACRQLKAIVMTDVLHHIPRPRQFFSEACRCLRPGGAVVMIEPWFTTWSGWVYRHLHHEPFDPLAARWEFPSSGPLSGANGALPWIVFERDVEQFKSEFPQLRIEMKQVMMPFRYLVSGGVSMRTLSPTWSYGLWTIVEKSLGPWMNHLGMFSLIVLKFADNG